MRKRIVLCPLSNFLLIFKCRRPAKTWKYATKFVWWHFLLQTANWHFRRVYALMNKTRRVGNSNFGFIDENLRIWKFCLWKVLWWEKCKITSSLLTKINYTIRKFAKKYIYKTFKRVYTMIFNFQQWMPIVTILPTLSSFNSKLAWKFALFAATFLMV